MARFTSTNQPAKRGRPKGRPNRSTILKHGLEGLDKMLDKSFENVTKSIEKGDIATSKWLIERADRREQERMSAEALAPLMEVITQIKTMEDIERVSEYALLLMIKGDMTFDQLRSTQEALARHTVFKGTIELSTLRAELEELREHASGGVAAKTDHFPAWGKLRADAVDVETPAGEGGT